MRKWKAWFFLPMCLEWVGSVCIPTLDEWKARATRRKSGAKLHVTDVRKGSEQGRLRRPGEVWKFLPLDSDPQKQTDPEMI